jgi:hypothetical protein
VSYRLRHTKISTTLDLYSFVIPSLQDGAVEIFDEALSIKMAPIRHPNGTQKEKNDFIEAFHLERQKSEPLDR